MFDNKLDQDIANGLDYITFISGYIAGTNKSIDKKYVEKIKNRKLGGVFMTALETFLEEGRENGILIGREEGIEIGEENKAIEIARNLKRGSRMTIKEISIFTGLTEKEIESL